MHRQTDVTRRHPCHRGSLIATYTHSPASCCRTLNFFPATLPPPLQDQTNAMFTFQEKRGELGRCPCNAHSWEACSVMLFRRLACLTVIAGLWLKFQRWQWGALRAGSSMTRYDQWMLCLDTDTSIDYAHVSPAFVEVWHLVHWFLAFIFLNTKLKCLFLVTCELNCLPTLPVRVPKSTGPALSKRDIEQMWAYRNVLDVPANTMMENGENEALLSTTSLGFGSGLSPPQHWAAVTPMVSCSCHAAPHSLSVGLAAITLWSVYIHLCWPLGFWDFVEKEAFMWEMKRHLWNMISC